MTTNNTCNKKEHAPECTCSICGTSCKGFPFRNGYVCESCLKHIKESDSFVYGSSKQRD